MKNRNDLDTRIADWVADLPSRAPDDTLDHVLAELPTLPQYGRLRAAALRSTHMSTTARGARASYAVPLATAAVIAVAVVGAGILFSRNGSNPGVGGAKPNVSASVAPSSGASLSPAAAASAVPVNSTTIPVAGPFEIHATDEAVWATSSDGLVRIDPATNETQLIELPAQQLTAVASTGDAIWVSDYQAAKLYRVDPDTNEVSATLTLPVGPTSLVAEGDKLYVASKSNTMVVDTVANTVVQELKPTGGGPTPVAFGSLWAIATTGVNRFDPATDALLATISVPDPSDTCGLWPLAGVKGMNDSIVAGCFAGTYLSRIDVETNELIGTYELGENGGQSIAIEGSWWVPLGPVDDGGLGRIDAATGQVVQLVDLGRGNGPSGMTVSATDLWVVSEANQQIVRLPLSELRAP